MRPGPGKAIMGTIRFIVRTTHRFKAKSDWHIEQGDDFVLEIIIYTNEMSSLARSSNDL